MAPNQVWCWDMTFLPKSVRRMLVLPHLILDLYSRKVVGWEVQRSDNSDHAAHLVRRTALAESIG
jgi:putative transposase